VCGLEPCPAKTAGKNCRVGKTCLAQFKISIVMGAIMAWRPVAQQTRRPGFHGPAYPPSPDFVRQILQQFPGCCSILCLTWFRGPPFL
jgi:hypothetical protein